MTTGMVVLGLATFALISCRQEARHSDSASMPAISQSEFPSTNPGAVNGRALFLKNCAHCHGATARGDEGPDLHDLAVSDQWIANRIRNGKAGEMTAFAGKLQPPEIDSLVVYLRTLK
jgi:mono/diheme cytochrome c family protein